MAEKYDPSIYEKPSVAVDLLVFTIEDGRLKILMIKREEAPFKGRIALPGVFVGINETLDAAAARGIKEETGLKDIYFEQLYTFGEVKRDPRMRIISVAYMALVISLISRQEKELWEHGSLMWKNFLNLIRRLPSIIRR